MSCENCAALQAQLDAANKKWMLYENEYVLPCFKWAEEEGIDLHKLVREAKGNCVMRLVEVLRTRLAEAQAQNIVARGYANSFERKYDEAQGRLREVEQERGWLQAEVARMRDWKNNLFDYLMSEDATVIKAVEAFRRRAVAAVRALFHNSEVESARWNQAITEAVAKLQQLSTTTEDE